jgi:hypothetical protein
MDEIPIIREFADNLTTALTSFSQPTRIDGES